MEPAAVLMDLDNTLLDRKWALRAFHDWFSGFSK